MHLCLARDRHPDCRDDYRARWILTHAVLVQPGVDMRRLRRAGKLLAARHDSLRIRFMILDQQFRAAVTEDQGDLVREVDIGDVDDATFRSEVSAIAQAPMSLLESQLAELVVVHCGQRGDVLLWRLHHAITDGYGILVLIEDFLRLLVGLPFLTPALSYKDYVARFLQVPPKRAAEIRAFWEDLHRNLPKAPNIGRKAKGMQPLWRNLGDVDGRRKQIRLTARSVAALDRKGRQEGLRTTSILFTGFLEALCQLYDTEALAYTTLLARSDPALSNFAGAHYFDPVLPYRAAGKRGLFGNARTLFEHFMQANAHLPSDAASQSTAYEDALIEAGIYPRQFSVHQPRSTRRLKHALLPGASLTSRGQTQMMGPYRITPLDVSVFRRSRVDLRFMIRDSGDSTGFDLEYDGISYADAEIDAIAARLCDLTGLEQES